MKNRTCCAHNTLALEFCVLRTIQYQYKRFKLVNLHALFKITKQSIQLWSQIQSVLITARLKVRILLVAMGVLLVGS